MVLVLLPLHKLLVCHVVITEYMIRKIMKLVLLLVSDIYTKFYGTDILIQEHLKGKKEHI